ncbi:hypothetical protein [Phenylobacterium sp.]|uniref:hypothetical protein n=1 Tax=Phenylobacterium sp. TaxID=1871053 RepID=UPI002F92494D
MSSRSIWRTLGIAATRDRSAIRRAYSVRLKATNPEDDPEGFQELRSAYERALAMAEAPEAYAEPVQPEADWTAGPADDPFPERSRPEPAEPRPPAEVPGVSREEVADLQARFERLDRLLDAPERDEDAILIAFDYALRAPALEAVVLRDQAEAWVASAILDRAPQADLLIPGAIQAFGWSDAGLDWRHTWVDAVLARHRTLEVVARLSSRRSPFHAGYRALVEPPVGLRAWRNRLTPGLPGKVRVVLHHLDEAGAPEQLDTAALAWWTERLRRRRPWVEWSILAFLSFSVAGGYFQSTGVAGASPPEFWGTAAAMVVLAAVAVGVGAGPARRALRRRWPFSEPAWLRYGWALAGVGVLALAGLAPTSPPVTLAVLGLGLLTLVWSVALASPDLDEPEVLRLRYWWIFRADLKLSRAGYMAVSLLPLLLLHFSVTTDLADRAWGQTGLALVLVGAAQAAGYKDLRAAWLGATSARTRIVVLGMALAAVAALPTLLWATAPGPRWVGGAVALVAVFMLGHMWALPERTGLTARHLIANLGWLPAIVIGVAVGDTTGQGNAALLFGGMWVLAIAAAGLVGALREEIVLTRPAPRTA